MSLDRSLAPAAAARLGRREFLVLGASAVLAGPALAQSGSDDGVVLTLSSTADAQPSNIMTLRAGNMPWVKNVFESLTLINPETFDPEPLLARSWKFADDKLSLDITLRDDVTFHTGRKMTADDVKYSFDVAAMPETADQTGFIAKDFDSVDVTGPHSLTIKFKRPVSNIFDFFELAVIVDKETYGQRADGSKVVGTGPYRFTAWTPGAQITLKKYAGHRDAAKVKIDEIDIAVIPDSTASISALRSQRTVLAYGLATSDVVEFERNPTYKIEYSGGTIYPFGVDVTKAPFDKKEVRQALGYAVDRQRINQQVFEGTGTPTDLFWSPSAPGYTDSLANRYSYDPDKAKQMIAAAGAAGAKVPITLAALPAARSIFEIVQNNLRAVGLDPVANVLDVTEYDKRQVAGDMGPAFILLHGQVGFSSTTLLSSLPSLRQGNPSHFWNDDYAGLCDAMRAATTRDQLASATTALTDYMLDQAFNLSLVQAAGPIVIASQLQGLRLGVHGELIFGDTSLAD